MRAIRIRRSSTRRDGSGSRCRRQPHRAGIDPATGESEARDSLTPRSRPYGVITRLEGRAVRRALFGTNKVARLDPRRWRSANLHAAAKARARARMAITPDDAIWYTDYARGYRRAGSIRRTGKRTRMALARRAEVAALRDGARSTASSGTASRT